MVFWSKVYNQGGRNKYIYIERKNEWFLCHTEDRL